MVGVAQLVESRIVIPVVVGSSPISHPTIPSLSRFRLGLFLIRNPHNMPVFIGYSPNQIRFIDRQFITCLHPDNATFLDGRIHGRKLKFMEK